MTPAGAGCTCIQRIFNTVQLVSSECKCSRMELAMTTSGLRNPDVIAHRRALTRRGQRMIGALVIFIVREKAGTQPSYGALHPLRSNNGREFALCLLSRCSFCLLSCFALPLSLTHSLLIHKYWLASISARMWCQALLAEPSCLDRGAGRGPSQVETARGFD